MKEAEYRLLDPNNLLPLYDWDDARADEVDHPGPDDMDFFSGVVRQAVDLIDANVMLADTSLVFRGGLRFSYQKHSFVHAYFWERQTPNQPPPIILKFPANDPK